MLYILGGCSEKCLVDGSIYLSVMFEYVSFPVCPGICALWNVGGVVWLCSCRFD